MTTKLLIEPAYHWGFAMFSLMAVAMTESTVALLALFVVNVITGLATWWQTKQAAKKAQEAAAQVVELNLKADRDRAEIKRTLEAQAEKDAIQARSVKDALIASSVQVGSKLNILHELGNSTLLAQKETLAITARTLADVTQKPEHLKFAEETESAASVLRAQAKAMSLKTLSEAQFPPSSGKDNPPIMGDPTK